MTNLISTLRSNAASNPRFAKVVIVIYTVLTLGAGGFAYAFGASLPKALLFAIIGLLVVLSADVAAYLYIHSNPVLLARMQAFADGLVNAKSDWDDTDDNCGDPDCDECNQDRSL